MTPFLYRIGQLCVRRRAVVLGVWLLVAVGLSLWTQALGGTQVTDNVTLPGTGSQRAMDVVQRGFGSVGANGSNPIVFRAPAGAMVTTPRVRAAVDRVTRALARDPAVLAAVSPFSPAGAVQVSRDRRTAYIALTLRASAAQLTHDEATRLFALMTTAQASGLDVAAGGYLGQELSGASSGNSEAIGLIAAIVVLLLTFGTIVAMGMPILTAMFGLGTGLSIIALVSQVTEVPSAAPALATMVGLGVGIDYSLFVVTRHREQLAEGAEPRESVARAVATSGGAVVFAGATVTIALCSLALAGIPIVAQMGYLSAIAVVVAVLAAITLLPAVLAFVGRRINALRVPGLRLHHDPRPSAWTRWARLVAGRPWPALLVALVVVALLAAPVRGLDLGLSDSGQLPASTTARQAYDLLSEGFGPGFNGPLLVAVSGSRTSPDAAARLRRLAASLRAVPGVATVSPPLLSRRGTEAVLTVTPASAPSAAATTTLVHHLRGVTLPALIRGTGLAAFVGGSTAGSIDLTAAISDRLPLVIGIVLALSFVLLLIAFRAPLVALKAVVMNLLSIAAAFGLVTYVFGHSWTARLFGVDGVAPIVSFVPLMMFAILFGLSMDYEVFLMTHVRERWRVTHDAHAAVVEGLAGTARLITSAALIMCSVFLAFLLSGSPTIKQFGLGMAAAVAIDATVIRCVLVPATMALLGRSAWWMPRWLDRITPPLSIEGEAWFERLDHPAGSPAPAATPPAPTATPPAPTATPTAPALPAPAHHV